MKRYALLAASLLWAAPLQAQATVHVFACGPEWASLAEELGGDQVEATTATHASQDPHHVRAAPSLLAAMRRADLVVCNGSGLEIGWLPVLMQKAASAVVQPGQPGYLIASDYVTRLGVPSQVDRSQGDIHPEGNPHIQLNPYNIEKVAVEFARRLEVIDAEHAALYRQRLEDFRQRWRSATVRWEAEAAGLKGQAVIVHHESELYLLDWLGMRQLASLEPKPGLPPTAAHLEEVLQAVKDQPVLAILRAPYEDADASAWLASRIHAPAVQIPFTVGGDASSKDLFGLFDETVRRLVEAQRAQR